MFSSVNMQPTGAPNEATGNDWKSTKASSRSW
jgi:hypothetical protein